jgi:hypothetical protein
MYAHMNKWLKQKKVCIAAKKKSVGGKCNRQHKKPVLPSENDKKKSLWKSIHNIYSCILLVIAKVHIKFSQVVYILICMVTCI